MRKLPNVRHALYFCVLAAGAKGQQMLHLSEFRESLKFTWLVHTLCDLYS